MVCQNLIKNFINKNVTLSILIITIVCMPPADMFASETSKMGLNMCWLYQLQKAEPDEIIKSQFKIVVMDYSRNGKENNKYSISEINKMKAASIIPICYLSIGEAEEYRYYWRPEWKKKAKWLGKENPDWQGNFKVKYWHPEWQAIIISYLDEIIEQGFSGVYLDIVDGFEYWSDDENPEHCFSEEEAAEKMITFIKNLSIHARKKAGNNFKVIPQNGERLLDYDSDGSYLKVISGQGVEDIWYDGITPQPRNEVAERLSYLKKISISKKIVLAVEYVDDGSGYKSGNKKRIDKIAANCNKFGFYYYIAHFDRELDTINRIPNIQP
jgi:cysteinyl-tRNA synthetase